MRASSTKPCFNFFSTSMLISGRRDRGRRPLVVSQLAQAGARPLDGEPLRVQEMANFQQELEVLAPVEPLLRPASFAAAGTETPSPSSAARTV